MNESSNCRVEDDEFVPCPSMEEALKYRAIKSCKFFSNSFVIGTDPEMVIEFCPFCAEQV